MLVAPPTSRGRHHERFQKPAAVDVVITSVVAFPTLMDAWWNEEGSRQADGITFALAGVSVLALLVRRRWPVGVSVLCGTALTALYLIDHHGELLNLPTMIALYTVAVQGHRRRTVAVGAIASAWSGGLAMAAGSPVGSPILEMLWPVVPLALGEVVRMRHAMLAEYEERAAQAEADRERDARHRVQTERVRIAREFHDVVAHTMAAVNVQMSVAVAAFDARPEAARAALVQARASSKQALTELRATIELLRDGAAAEPAAPLPAPTIAQVEDLAETARAAGIAVTVDLDLDVAAADLDVPSAVELATHRIVQEALTNVIRHADATEATVSVTRQAAGPSQARSDPSGDGTCLIVEVVDNGHGRPGATGALGRSLDARAAGLPAGGYGILGMSERATALGGRLEYGPTGAGGFRIRAVLPLDEGGR
jgi:signal transduction histidine kinase